MSYILCDFFFFNDTATTEIYTLSLHDALPIFRGGTLGSEDARGTTPHEAVWRPIVPLNVAVRTWTTWLRGRPLPRASDRKSTRLNSSHANISYAVFCLKKKNILRQYTTSKS